MRIYEDPKLYDALKSIRPWKSFFSRKWCEGHLEINKIIADDYVSLGFYLTQLKKLRISYLPIMSNKSIDLYGSLRSYTIFMGPPLADHLYRHKCHGNQGFF